MNWLNKKSQIFLSNGYLSEGEDAIERIKSIASAAEGYLGKEGFADRFYYHMEKGHFLLSSPVWANFGKKRGFPIACFNSHVEDTMDSILYNTAEVGMMTKMGGGTSGYFGEIRQRGAAISTGGISDGAVTFMQLFDSVSHVCKQADVRRGKMAAYLPIDHGDIEDFLNIRKEGHPIQDLLTGVVVKDDWLEEMKGGDKEKRKVWAKVLESRAQTGLPYIYFYDNANNAAPQVYKDKDRDIKSSNLCSEIMLSSDKDESFVCCLGSMNLLHYDDWKDTDAVEIMSLFLDSVLTEFIQKSEGVSFMQRPRNFAINQRAIGIGATGYHSVLQSKMIPFESLEAQMLNTEMFETIKNQSLEASKKAAKEMGEPPMLEGRGERWVTRMAVAPNTSSAFILGQVSQSIEPFKSNYYVKDIAKFKGTIKNKYLEKLLEEKDKNTSDVWDSILRNNGSVQQLDFLTEKEKAVFKTFAEISQKEIITQAAQRQKHIDQGQSLNIMIPSGVSAKEMNQLTLYAWESGVKSLYYQHSSNAAQELFRKFNEDNCSACEG